MSFDGNNMNGRSYKNVTPPEWEKELKALIDKFKKMGDKIIFLPLLVLATILIFSSFYTVQPKEEAVVLRFGAYQSTNGPGLHFKIPFGVDRVIILPTRLVLQEEFGFRTRDTSGHRTTYDKQGYLAESHMLTGDLNVADVEWVVQFRIADPNKYLFKVRDPIRNVRDVAESIMRRVVGDKPVGRVLTTGRVEIASEAKTLMQEVLDKYDIGINVVSIKLQDVNPPEVVKASFNEVNSAKQEQEQLINLAEKEYNKMIPEAHGQAEQKIAEAQGYASALINRAQGDAQKFSALVAEYRKAPRVTKSRIYLETMEKIYLDMKKVTIVDPNIKGLLPIFSNKLSSGDN